ncbi:hypothetical protein F5878DRAFT_645992 [Lentinula raphanica]|uniref:Uncharacterized protein n=1 Tax=Lentinula raphanica TaxID=153919 RepID=A0AA38U868_9AGAR|nr:hypothetical protein F5878DRAFT_645992 [Lentinula raphanica]
MFNVASITMLYFIVSILPLWIAQCPYKTTFSELLYYIFQLPQVAYWRFLLSVVKTEKYEKWRDIEYAGDITMLKGINHKKQFNVLKDIEHQAACCHSIEGNQNLIFKALWWLGDSTSNVSVKEIILESLGAFPLSMKDKLCTPRALQVLYGCYINQFHFTWDLVFHYGNHPNNLEKIFRSMIHLCGSTKEIENQRKEMLKWLILFVEPDFWDVSSALAFWAADDPLDFDSYNNISQYPRPSEGLSWLVNNYVDSSSWEEIMVPPLVWEGLFRASSNKVFQEQLAQRIDKWWKHSSCPGSCPVPIEDLIRIAGE